MFTRYPRYPREMILLTRVLLCRRVLRIKEFRREKNLASLYRFITLRSDTFARRNIFAILCTDTTLPDRIKMCINFLRFFFFYFFTRECYPITLCNRFLRFFFFFLRFKSVYL